MLQCQFCNKDFTSKSNLNYHKKTAKFCLELQGKSAQEFTCEFCNKTFSSKGGLIKHISVCSTKEEIELNKLNKTNINLEENNEFLKIENIQIKKENQMLHQKNNEYIEKINKLENALIGIAESKNEINNQSYDRQIQELTNKYGKKQPRQQIQEPNVIYILTTEPLKKERRYIFGKSKNLTSRLSTYNKTDEHEVIYYQPCGTESNMDVVEKLVLNKLDKYREVENRDRFILPENKEIEFFIGIIKKNIEFVLSDNEN
jgi:cell division protein FtsB